MSAEGCFPKALRIIKTSSKSLKSAAVWLYYNTSHAVPISHGSTLTFQLIHKLLEVIMGYISKMFHTFTWCFVFVISNFAWLICIKNMKLNQKVQKFSWKFNWKFNSIVLMSVQGYIVSELTGKFTKFTFLLIKSARVTQTREQFVCRELD